MSSETNRQSIAASIKALYQGFMSTRSKLFDVVEIPHLVEIDGQSINISRDFCCLEKSLKYMKENSNRHVYLRASADARNLIDSLKFILRAVMNYKKSVFFLDFDKDQDILEKYLLMEEYFDYSQYQNEDEDENEDNCNNHNLTHIQFL